MGDDIRAETLKLIRRPAIWTLLAVALLLSLTFTYLVPYAGYAGGTGGPTAVKQANLNHQVFQVGEGIANLDNKPSQEFEKALRAKYDFSLFYPRAVNQMRMLAAAADKAKSMLGAKRPDIKIVGDELHPLLKITDFAPYIAKIKASGADTVVTGNWGQDFALLLKAAADAGLKVSWYTYYAGGTGGPTAVKQANLNHQVFQVGEGIPNLDNKPSQEFEKALRAKYDFSLFYPRAVNQMRMLAAAADKAKSIDPVKVALALEGMEFDVFNGGKGNMRKDDHQFFQPIYISSLGDRTEKEPFDEEKTGWGWKLIAKIDTAQTTLPTTCKMERPK